MPGNSFNYKNYPRITLTKYVSVKLYTLHENHSIFQHREGQMVWESTDFSIHVYYQHVIHCPDICDPLRYQRANQQSYFKVRQTYITVNKLYQDIFMVFFLNSGKFCFNKESSNTIASILKWRQIPNNATWPDDVIVEIRMLSDFTYLYRNMLILLI